MIKAEISKFNKFLKANLQRQPDLLGGVEQEVFFRRLNESQDSDAVLDQVLVEKLSVPRVHPEVRVEVLEDNDAVLAHALRDFDEVGKVLADNAQLEKENQENVLQASKFIEDYQVNVNQLRFLQMSWHLMPQKALSSIRAKSYTSNALTPKVS